jgi:light-regulated signal transduction histidine kinase (bacteriophytochrome)
LFATAADGYTRTARRYRNDNRSKNCHNRNQELAKRAAELEASNKELEAAGSVAHDLRAPFRHSVGLFWAIINRPPAGSIQK